MIHFDLPKEKSSIIKVIGVGGGGSNAVNHMHAQSIEGVNFIICNTDAQAIAQSNVPNKIQLGPNLTQGLGAGANPDIGRQATEESLEEIKRILEVNTKMAFITAGMGGGTGTGGAPIISKICKDLGILTVGIVTTPFGYEGKKRQQQADEGISRMKEYVDTLLIISNDKLRHQFGNLKMKEAFSKADNVLATAAKCITDVINSTGQINVDFADVCTVMRNGGKAILGNAAAAGEDRARKAIEEALNSPLLNDNDIRGARWILININSSAGEFEFTMDEVEVIQNIVLSQAGEDTDVIMGMGYDESLGDQIGITLIATGFEEKKEGEYKNAVVPSKTVVPKEPEKVVLVLGEETTPTKTEQVQFQPAIAAQQEELPFSYPTQPFIAEAEQDQTAAANSGGYLTKPTVIYEQESGHPVASEKEDVAVPSPTIQWIQDDTDVFDMQLIEKDVALTDQVPVNLTRNMHADEQPGIVDEEDEQKKKAAERLQKLRNISFNIYGGDANHDFDTVPAYMRRNLDLYSTISPAENFYSNYTVKNDENNQSHINKLNSFLDGNKPD
ncbi:MAG: cell division protein FtsZ [Bacteroidetes bacterium]|nr:cell division protein FtsZ [Bacteroidota bacterium]